MICTISRHFYFMTMSSASLDMGSVRGGKSFASVVG